MQHASPAVAPQAVPSGSVVGAAHIPPLHVVASHASTVQLVSMPHSEHMPK
jgi:hypothetical protein